MTAQAHENLILNGKKTSMATCPYIPSEYSRTNELLKTIQDIMQSSSCWRGYIGTWKIKDNKLYLTKLKGKFTLPLKYHLPFSSGIFADWFSGTLIVPQGDMLRYVHSGFDSTFEEELQITIESGIVTGSTTIKNN